MNKPYFPLLIAIFASQTLSAKIWQVGPARSYTAPSAVANLVANGDTVEIDAGLYNGDVARWTAHNLLIRSVGGGYAHLEAAGNYIEGKAIWVIKGNDCTVEGIEFSGCKVPDHNGAGIRQEGRNLTLRNCYFHHNEMGILTANDGVSDYLFERCEFSHNGYGDGYSHNIYVGAVNSLTMWFCYSHDAKIGHLVKSRARYNYLYYNRLSGENGDGSYEVDLPNGGRAILIGNVIEQGPQSQNGGIVSFGLENPNHPEQQLALSHNTIVNNRFSGRFVQFSNATAALKMVNNLFLGPGTLTQGNATAVDTSHNIWLTNIAAGMLSDPANFDFWPLAGSPAVNAGTDNPGEWFGTPLQAQYAYLHPTTGTPRWKSGQSMDVGAYELLMAPYRSLEKPESARAFSVRPNPVASDQGHIVITWDEAANQDGAAQLFDLSGRLVRTLRVPKGATELPMSVSGLPPGSYWLSLEGHGPAVRVLVF
jgi:hypothetical protein